MLVPFSPPPGLNSDDTSFAAQGRWADGNNVRFWHGRPQAIGDSGKIFTASLGDVRNIFPFIRSGSVNVAYGTTTKLYVGSGISTPSDRSPAGIVTEAWSLGAWGSTLLGAPQKGTLYEQSGTGTATAVSAAPAQITYMLVSAERQVLAFGCNEEASPFTFNPLCIRGSDLEDYTNWTTSSTNNAFEHILDGDGAIVAARQIGSYVAVWTTDALYLGQFIGDPSQAYRFDKVADDCGLCGQRAATIYNGAAFWLGTDLRLRRWVPGALPEIISCPISKAFADDINTVPIQLSRTIVCSVPKYQEIWLCYSAASGTIHYVGVSLVDGTWFKGDQSRGSMSSSDLLLVCDSNPSFSSATWYSDLNGNIFAAECEMIASVGGAPPAAYIQSADQYIDNGQRRMMIRRLIPDFEYLDVNASLTLYCRDRPSSTPVTKGPYTIGVTADKVDFRSSSSMIAAKFSFTTGTRWRLGKPIFDIVTMGER